MDKKASSLKLKVIGSLNISLILFNLAAPIFCFDLSYIYTRDSSRADSCDC